VLRIDYLVKEIDAAMAGAPSKVASNAPKEGTATMKFVTRDNAASAVR